MSKDIQKILNKEQVVFYQKSFFRIRAEESKTKSTIEPFCCHNSL